MSLDNGDPDRVRAAIRQGLDRLDAKDEVEVFDRLMAHMETGARALLGKMTAEKMCGMTHTEELNRWYDDEKARQGKS